MCALQVGCFAILCWTNVYVLDFRSSTLPFTPGVHLSEGSGQKQTNNQHQMTTVVSGGLPLWFWYQTSSRCIVHAFG